MKRINDVMFMLRAMKLAEKGRGNTNPNPLVGAVIVEDDIIIAEGYHKAYGLPHAEREAINNFYANNKNRKASLKDTTLYVTLEPCNHDGKTPPCTDIIIEQEFARIVVGITDPNPLMSGKSIDILRNKGIKVELINDNEIIQQLLLQNKIFTKYISQKKPYVLLKSAMTMDGKIACTSGDSKWITNEKSRAKVHKWRHHYASVLVGSNTVNKDNPMLTCRHNDIYNINQPTRIIVASDANVPINSNLVKTAHEIKTVIAYSNDISEEKKKSFESKGVVMLKCNDKNGKVDIDNLTDRLYDMGIDSILLEGGGEVNYSFLAAGCVDEVAFFIAPKIVGGKNASSPVGGEGFTNMNYAVKLKDINFRYIDDDILIRAMIDKDK